MIWAGIFFIKFTISFPLIDPGRYFRQAKYPPDEYLLFWWVSFYLLNL